MLKEYLEDASQDLAVSVLVFCLLCWSCVSYSWSWFSNGYQIQECCVEDLTSWGFFCILFFVMRCSWSMETDVVSDIGIWMHCGVTSKVSSTNMNLYTRFLYSEFIYECLLFFYDACNCCLDMVQSSDMVNTHTQQFCSTLSGTAWVSQYQKDKPFWILLKQRWWGGSGINWTICKSFASYSRQITMTTPYHSSFLYGLDALFAAKPTASKHWRKKVTWLM